MPVLKLIRCPSCGCDIDVETGEAYVPGSRDATKEEPEEAPEIEETVEAEEPKGTDDGIHPEGRHVGE